MFVYMFIKDFASKKKLLSFHNLPVINNSTTFSIHPVITVCIKKTICSMSKMIAVTYNKDCANNFCF